MCHFTLHGCPPKTVRAAGIFMAVSIRQMLIFINLFMLPT